MTTTPARLGKSRGVLIVEDEEQLLSLVSSFLESEEFLVFCARDGVEGLQKFRGHQNEIDLLWTDLGLPELGGADLITAIRYQKPSIKIIGVSGLSGTDVSRIALHSGADMFVAKPFHIDDIFRAIKSVLGE